MREQENINRNYPEEVTKETAAVLFQIRKRVDDPNDEKLEKEVDSYTDSHDKRAFTVSENGNVLGYVEVKLNEDLPANSKLAMDVSQFGHLARIGVLDEARGRGIGSVLLDKGEDWIRSSGKVGVWLDFRADNLPAANLYESHGYVVVDAFEDGEVERKISLKKF